MPFTIKTDELPVSARPPFAYKATVAAFELRIGQESGEPSVNVTLMTPRGKRFDAIRLKNRWFESDFDPRKITDTKERNLFFMSIGAKNRVGKLRRYLGDYKETIDSVEQLVEILTAVAVGKEFLVKEVQRRDNGEPRNDYNLYLYDLDRPPRSWGAGTIVLLEEEEPVKDEPAADEEVPF